MSPQTVPAQEIATSVFRCQRHGCSAICTPRSAISAAKSYAANVATYNYKTLPADFGRVKAESTPQFRSSFEKLSAALAKVLTQYQATATAVAIDAGLASITSSQAVVIVFINQTVNNTAQKHTTTDESRVKVTLERSGGKWLLAYLAHRI
jgi:Mce-associated membrane protein